jgi:hypothetical protein
MSLIVAAPIDYATLPAALLPQAKTHCRVDFDRDDAVLVERVGWAIQQFEMTDTKVFGQSWIWTPDETDFVDGQAKSPINPVMSFAADIGGTDATADYSFVTGSTTQGTGTYWLVGDWADGLTLTLDSGYANAADIPPGIVREILERTATYYENRELLIGSQSLSPLALPQQLAGWWIPKV